MNFVASCFLLISAGCATTAAPVGGRELPSEVKRLSGQPLAALADDAFNDNIWSQIELARRLETGEGIAADRECAYYWYRSASRLRYNAGLDGRNIIAGYTRHPVAIDGLERLEAGGPLKQNRTDTPSDEIEDRCTDTLEDIVSMWKFGRPAQRDR